MEELKSLFGEGSLSYEEFNKKLGEMSETLTLVNVKSGDYVSRNKYADIEKKMNKLQEKYNALSDNTQGYEDLQSKYETLKTDYDTLVTKKDLAEKMSLISGANVNPKFAKFVYSEVQSMANDDKDFQTALNEYLKDNKEFLNVKQGTYVDLEKGDTAPKTKNEIMNNLIRRK